MNFCIKKIKRLRVFLKHLRVFRSLVFKVSGPYGETVLFTPTSTNSLLGFEPDSLKGCNKTAFQKIFSYARGLITPFKQRLAIKGTGYKGYCPRVFERSSFVFRIGFGGAEIGTRLGEFVKGRARRQRIILFSPFYERLTDDVSTVLGLKNPDPYKAKGIKLPSRSYPLKPGKVRSNR